MMGINEYVLAYLGLTLTSIVCFVYSVIAYRRAPSMRNKKPFILPVCLTPAWTLIGINGMTQRYFSWWEPITIDPIHFAILASFTMVAMAMGLQDAYNYRGKK